jgi:hypothetical protein
MFMNLSEVSRRIVQWFMDQFINHLSVIFLVHEACTLHEPISTSLERFIVLIASM